MKCTLESVGFRYRLSGPVLSQVSLTLGSGAVAILGPNGSGKSTLLKILTTVLIPTEGTLAWGGVPARGGSRLRAVRAQLGFAPQGNALPGHLTPSEAVRYALWLKGGRTGGHAEPVARSLDLVSMPTEYRTVPFSRLSGGYQRRTVVACALAHDPQVLILDEPTAGLDQKASASLRQDLGKVRNDCLVLVATHLDEDVAALCDRAIALSHGRIAADVTRVAWETTPDLLSGMARGEVGGSD